jgi:hypothetical protein
LPAPRIIKRWLKIQEDILKRSSLTMDEPENQYEAMAAVHDQEAEETGRSVPEVVFGLAYRYVQPGQSILDTGIGTGLSSVLFPKAGLGSMVYGHFPERNLAFLVLTDREQSRVCRIRLTRQ